MLAEFLDPTFLKSKLDLVDLSITGLRDALRGTGNKTLTDLDTRLADIYSRLDVALSTRASESTLATRLSEATFTGRWDGGIYGWDGTTPRKIKTDTAGELQIDVLTLPVTKGDWLSVIPNPPNLDVALSTRASENTLATRLSEATFTARWDGGIYGFDGITARKIKTDTDGELQIDVLTLPVTPGAWLTSIPNPPNLDVALSTRASEATLAARLSEATFTARVPTLAALTKDVSGGNRSALVVLASLAHDYTRMPYMVDDISVTTTESSTSIAAPGAKVVKITNKGDVDVLIGVNGSVPTTNPLKVRARTAKIFLFGGATSISYKTATGSSTISIEWFN